MNVSSLTFFSNLGYNHPALKAVISNPENMASLINRPAGGHFPHDKWVRLVNEVMMSVAPKGMDQLRFFYLFLFTKTLKHFAKIFMLHTNRKL